MFNRKPTIAAILLAAIVFFSGFVVGIAVYRKYARARIVYDTVYLSSFTGDELALPVYATSSPRLR